MKLTHASSYALYAVVYLAGQKSQAPIASHTIAEEQGIPERFLLKVLKPMVSAGILRSTKGPHGGYYLARSPADISVLDIVEAVDGPIRGHVSFVPTGQRVAHKKLEEVCEEVAEVRRKLLKKVTIASLIR